MNKFIITQSGELRFGDVELHRDLIPEGDDTCHGGGFWRIDPVKGFLLLYGRSYDFGSPVFGCLKSISRETFPARWGCPIFYLREFCGQEVFEPVTV